MSARTSYSACLIIIPILLSLSAGCGDHANSPYVSRQKDSSESYAARCPRVDSMLGLCGGGGAGGGGAPTVPIAISPHAGARDVRPVPKLKWRSSDPDPGDSLRYEVQLGETPTNLTTISPPNLSSSGLFVPNRLKRGHDYYWKVIVRDTQGHVIQSPAWKFRTQSFSRSLLFRVALQKNSSSQNEDPPSFSTPVVGKKPKPKKHTARR